ncbi:MAG TPA: MFS transporter [Thermodesulfobacteriota bacterium]|nr:MFS transporter [Thermodesulfobacteriota bacterium]
MKINKKALTILSAGHAITDINQGVLPVLLPFFKEAFSLSYTMAGVILLFGNLTSSVIQPVFGYYSDKRPIGWLLPLAPFIACLGLSISGFVPNYSFLLVCVIVSGIGIASFHPEGFKTAYFFTGQKKATGMSIFSVGGNLGIALGPMCVLTLVTSFGLKGTLGMIVPGMLMAGILFLSLSWLSAPVHSAFIHLKKQPKQSISQKETISLLLLIGIVTLRSFIQYGLMTYIPFYYLHFLKGDPLYAGKLISTFLMAGALGTLIGAPLADLWGHKKFLAATMIATFPLLLYFNNSEGWIAFAIFGISGMVLISTFSVTVVMAQTLLPQRLGMASGLTAGFSVGTGGIGVTLLGIIADHWGVPTAMKSILIFPLIGFGLSLLLKYPPEKAKILADR